MNKGKKNKGNILLIVYALCALAAFIAEIYFMVNYKKEYVIIIAIGLVFLTSVGFLLEELFDSVASKPVDNSMDELLKVQKAAYLQGRNLTEEINRLFEDGIDSITQAFEDNTKAIIDNEKNIAKVIIKRNDDSNEKIRAAVEEIDLSKIPVPEISIPEINIPEIKIPEIKLPEMSLPEMTFPASDNSVEIESAKNEIISLIEKLSEQVKNSAKMEDIIEIREMLSKGIQNVNMENMTELVDEMLVAEEVPAEEEAPIVEDMLAVEEVSAIEEVPVVEEMLAAKEVPAEEEAPVVEDMLAVEEVPAIEEVPIVEEMASVEKVSLPDKVAIPEDFDINAENTFDDLFKDLADEIVNEPVPEMPVIEESVVEELTENEPIMEEQASEVTLPAMDDDPNKQLSADEIAALFASIQ